MAVVPRKDSEGVVFYVANKWNGRQKSERVGRNRREAERRDAAMKKEIENGTYMPPTQRRSMSFGDYATTWHGKRTNKWADGERAYTKNHFESRPWFWKKPMTEFRPIDIDQLIAELRAVKKPDGKRRLSDKTISDLLGQLKRMFASAMRAEVCDRQPVVLEPGTIKRAPTTIREPYTAAEAAVLMRHHEVPWPVRVLIALWLLAGLRQGEGCGLQWKKLDLEVLPLPSMLISEQWEGQTLKTERPRLVPMHPELLAILRGWAETGFELYVGRKPTPEDYIVPELDKRGRAKCFGAHTSYRRFINACAAAGVRARTLHSCRHTFVTLCRRGGARADVLERVTHNSSGSMIDRYTHFDWAPLCEAVLCLKLESPPILPSPERNRADIEVAADQKTGNIPEESAVCTDAGPVVCPPRLSGSPENIPADSIGTEFVQADVQGSVRGRERAKGATYRSALRAVNEKRVDRLLALAAFDPDAVRPGLVACRALESVWAGDVDAAVELIRKEALRHG